MLAVLSPVTLVQVIVGMPQGLIDDRIDAEFLNKGEKVDLPLCPLTASTFQSPMTLYMINSDRSWRGGSMRNLDWQLGVMCYALPYTGGEFRQLNKECRHEIVLTVIPMQCGVQIHV